MRDVRLSLRATVLFWSVATFAYLLLRPLIDEAEFLGTLTLGDLALAVILLGWMVVAIRWLVLRA